MNTNIEESDSEFWIEFETNPDLEKLKKGKFFNIPAILNEKIVNFERKLVQENASDNVWIKDFYKEKIERLRDAKAEEITSSTIITRNKIKKRYTSTIEQLESKYHRDLYILKSEFLNFRDLLKEKDSYIHDLIELLSEAGLYFSEVTISSLHVKKPPKKQSAQSPEVISLILEVKTLQAQIVYLKDLCAIYQNDTEKANAKADYYENEYIRMEKLYKEEIARLIEDSKIREKQHQDDKLNLCKE